MKSKTELERIEDRIEKELSVKHMKRYAGILVIAIIISAILAFVAYQERGTGDRLRNEFSPLRIENEFLKENTSILTEQIVGLTSVLNSYKIKIQEQEIVAGPVIGNYDFTEANPVIAGIDDDSDNDGLADDIDNNPDGGSIKVGRTVTWSYKGKAHSLTYTMNGDWYDYYKAKPRQTAKEHYITPGHPLIIEISDGLRDIILDEGYQSYTELVLSFVQYIPFKEDLESVGYGYPRFPIETLQDFEGDCEDMTYLAASILLNLEIDTVLIDIPGHIVPGVACANCDGVSYSYAGRDYYYIEPTASGWSLGEIPDEYKQYEDGDVLVRGLSWR